MRRTATLFADSLRPGVYCIPESLCEQAKAEAQQLGLRWEILKLNQPTLSAALQAMGKTLGLPEWFGANLDALYDCLCDPDSFPAAQGFVIAISQIGAANEAIIDVLSDVIASRNMPGQAAWLLVPPSCTRFPPLPHA